MSEYCTRRHVEWLGALRANGTRDRRYLHAFVGRRYVATTKAELNRRNKTGQSGLHTPEEA